MSHKNWRHRSHAIEYLPVKCESDQRAKSTASDHEPQDQKWSEAGLPQNVKMSEAGTHNPRKAHHARRLCAR